MKGEKKQEKDIVIMNKVISQYHYQCQQMLEPRQLLLKSELKSENIDDL